MFSKVVIHARVHMRPLVSRCPLSSSSSKTYICDPSAIEAYRTNEKFKKIIDRQEHRFYYIADQRIQQLPPPPPVFQKLPADSHFPEHSRYLIE